MLIDSLPLVYNFIMISRPKNQLYYLKLSSEIDATVAHLFEHAYIWEFYDYVISKGHNPDIICDIRGNTFDDIVFMYNASGNQLGNQLLAEFVKLDQTQINANMLQQSLLQISVEDKLNYQIISQNELERQINCLLATGFKPVDQLKSLEIRQPAQSSKASCLHDVGELATKTATINYVLDSSLVNDWAIFANIFPLLTFTTSRSLINCGAYYLCNVVELDNVDGRKVIIGGIDYAVPASCNLDDIHNSISDLLDNNPAINNPDDLQSYIEQKYTPAGLIYDYQSIGVLESWPLLQKLLTVNNLSDVWSRTQIYSIDESARQSN